MSKIDFELESMFIDAQFNQTEYLRPILNRFINKDCERLQFVLNGRIPSKKNSRVTNRKTGRSFPSKDYSNWHKNAEVQLLVTRTPRKLLADLIAIVMIIFFPDNRIADLTNKAESIMDLLVDMQVIKNDNWQNTGPVLIVPALSINSPGAIIDLFIRSQTQCQTDFIHA